ncbi:antibiotic biosynthesis monooxygenase family protein [Sphingomonas bacterium]|uniref:antibiotic biosynthesis monooxygenase family protein n=1 Tax=Sphingomonas bacterium TaxID=1895847 RepID=UPI0015759F98|nr:antibiotic biosynthesis monooxygenase family protein [Sphingomonas bacterium]
MSVLCTATWVIRQECADDFVTTLGGMFAETRTHDGFIGIRLLKSETAENEFILLQEWETTQHHQAYVAFRGERGDLDRLAAMTAGPTPIRYWGADPLAAA